MEASICLEVVTEGKTRGSLSILQMDGIQTDLDDPEAHLCRKVMPG